MPKKGLSLAITAPVEQEDDRGWSVVGSVLHLPGGVKLGQAGFSNYKVSHVIGRGTQGEVRLVQHRETKKIFAMKSINIAFGDIRTGRQLSVELAAIHFNLSHVIRTYEVFYTQDGFLRFILEFAEYGGFGHVLDRVPGRRLEEPYLNIFARQMVMGIAQLHKSGFLHRDLKPVNLLLTKTGDVKIADFGVSSLLKQSRATTSVGSTAYMSPERVRSEEHGYPSDVWAIGVTLAEVAIGQFPFPGNAFDVCALVGDGRAYVDWEGFAARPDSAGRTRTFSPELIDFVSQCLKTETSDRATAQDLLAHPFVARYAPGAEHHPSGTPEPSLLDVVAKYEIPSLLAKGIRRPPALDPTTRPEADEPG